MNQANQASESIPTLVLMIKKNCVLIEELIGHLSPARVSLHRMRYPCTYSIEKVDMAIPLAIQTTELLQSIVKRLEERDAAKRDANNIGVVINDSRVEE